MRLLDYEVEIGLVIGRDVPVGTAVTEANLADYVERAGGDQRRLGARYAADQNQFYEAKSYPTFTPVGPALVLVDADELKRFGDLRLRLRVNGEIRQDSWSRATSSTYPCRPCRRYRVFSVLNAGDLVLTGTPVGTAIRAPKPEGDAKPPAGPPTLEMFMASQRKNPYYLHEGDVVEASVTTDDGAIDLGTQRNVVRYA